MKRISEALKRNRSCARKWFDGLFCNKKIQTKIVGEESNWIIVPALIGQGTRVLSGGAGRDISFEKELAERYGAKVAIFDPSPTGQSTFQRQLGGSLDIKAYPIGLSGISGIVKFALPIDPSEGSFRISKDQDTQHASFDCCSLSDACRLADFSEIDLLKIDIEGFEYEVLENMMADEIRPAQIAVEFHHFFPGISIVKTIKLVASLYRYNYKLIYKRRHDYLFLRRDVINSLKIRC